MPKFWSWLSYVDLYQKQKKDVRCHHNSQIIPPNYFQTNYWSHAPHLSPQHQLHPHQPGMGRVVSELPADHPIKLVACLPWWPSQAWLYCANKFQLAMSILLLSTAWRQWLLLWDALWVCPYLSGHGATRLWMLPSSGLLSGQFRWWDCVSCHATMLSTRYHGYLHGVPLLHACENRHWQEHHELCSRQWWWHQ